MSIAQLNGSNHRNNGHNQTVDGASSEAIRKRTLLFHRWQKTGNVTTSCAQAQVGRATFYYWKKRFDEGGFPALAEERSHAPINPRRIDEQIADEIVQMKQENPTWGKARICKRLNERHGRSVISPNTVRRVLLDAGLWNES